MFRVPRKRIVESSEESSDASRETSDESEESEGSDIIDARREIESEEEEVEEEGEDSEDEETCCTYEEELNSILKEPEPDKSGIAFSVQKELASPFHVACESVDVSKVESLLASLSPASIDWLDPITKKNAMEIACEKGSEAITQLLLNSGAKCRPLVSAVAGGNMQIVKILLEKGANVNETTARFNATSLHVAAGIGNAEITRVLLDNGANVNMKASHSHRHRQPIHAAAEGGNVEVAKLLLQRGAKIDALDGLKNTPLICALKLRNFEMAKYLIGRGANISHKNSVNKTALQLAIKRGSVEIVQLLVTQGAPYKKNNGTILECACSGSVEVIQFLLQLGVKYPTKNGKLLTKAVKKQKTDIVAWMLALKEDSPSFKALFHNKTPELVTLLCAACKNGNIPMVKLLKDHGADLNGRAENKLILVHACEKKPQDEVLVEYLLENGARAEGPSGFYFGISPLAAAAQKRHLNVVTLLLKHGAKVNAEVILEAGSANTPNVELLKILVENGAKEEKKWKRKVLYEAVIHLNMSVVRYMLERFGLSDIMVKRSSKEKKTKDGYGDSPLHWLCFSKAAKGRRREKIAKLLLRQSAAVDPALTQSELTPLQYAVEQRQADLVWIFTTAGANFNILTNGQSLWELCKGRKTRTALLHFWTPATHHFFPPVVQDAIICLLMIAKQQKWIFGNEILYSIFAYMAYNWFPTPPPITEQQPIEGVDLKPHKNPKKKIKRE